MLLATRNTSEGCRVRAGPGKEALFRKSKMQKVNVDMEVFLKMGEFI